MKSRTLNECLEGKKLYLKKHEESMAQKMFEYVDRDRKRLDSFLPWVIHIQNSKDELKYIKSTHEKWEKAELFDFGIFIKESNEYIGNIGVHTIHWPTNRGEIGYWILGDFEGKGYVSEAVTILEKHLFEVGFHRIEIRCSDLNHRSEGVPKRCGYTYEGMLRENVIEKGKYRNTKIFSKLCTD